MPGKGSGKTIPKPPIEQLKKEFKEQKEEDLLKMFKQRFEKNNQRHKGLEWDKIQSRLEKHPEKLLSLYLMEQTGGEPDVVGYEKTTDEYIFYDCSPQSPSGRRSICYDQKGLAEREKKGVFPAGSAVGLAETMGIELLTEEEYRKLQELGEFDTKSESWLKTPEEVRKLGGGIFGDRRYNRVFVFHNSAPSFYAGRGFRGTLKV